MIYGGRVAPPVKSGAGRWQGKGARACCITAPSEASGAKAPVFSLPLDVRAEALTRHTEVMQQLLAGFRSVLIKEIKGNL